MAEFRTVDDFTADRFAPTPWEDAGVKVRFARQLIGFVEADFPRERFTQPLYRRLSLTFGHIAHYDREGFYDTFFRTTEDKMRFLRQTIEHPCCGDPGFTYSDVERALQSWVRENGVLARYEERWAERYRPKMTRAEWDAHPKEYKGFLGGRPHRLAQDEKTGATILVPVQITGPAKDSPQPRLNRYVVRVEVCCPEGEVEVEAATQEEAEWLARDEFEPKYTSTILTENGVPVEWSAEAHARDSSNPYRPAQASPEEEVEAGPENDPGPEMGP